MKQVFLDVDGTILDSMYRHYKLLVDLLEEQNIIFELSYEEFKALKRKGLSTRSICLRFWDHLEHDLDIIIKRWIDRIESDFYLAYDTVYPEVFTFLKFIQCEYRIYFITARENQNGLLRQINAFALNQYIEEIIIVSPKDAVVQKSQEIAKRMTSKTILIGDTETEFFAGMDLEIETFLLNRGFRDVDYWRAKGVDSFHDLMEICSRLNLVRENKDGEDKNEN